MACRQETTYFGRGRSTVSCHPIHWQNERRFSIPLCLMQISAQARVEKGGLQKIPEKVAHESLKHLGKRCLKRKTLLRVTAVPP